MFGHSKINKQYTSMCEQADDIQLAWKPTKEDQVKVKGLKDIQILRTINNGIAYFESNQNAKKEDCIWLPNQYQLEKMDKSWRITWTFYEFIHSGLNKYLKYFKKEEELWLAFLMYKINMKIWNGKSWTNK